MLRRAAEEGPPRPLVVASLRLRWPDDDDRRLLIEAFGAALRGAIDDGVDVAGAFYDPGIDPTSDQPERLDGLVDRDRNPRPSACLAGPRRSGLPRT